MPPSRTQSARSTLVLLFATISLCLSSCALGPVETPAELEGEPRVLSEGHALTVADAAEIRALMKVRAQAVLDGDRSAFLATVDDYDVDVVAEQATLFDNLVRLPITDLTYFVGSSAREPERIPGNDPVVRPLVVEHLSMDGVLQRRLSSDPVVTFVRRDGTWLLGRESVTDDSLSRPWVGGAIEVDRSRGFMVISDEGAQPSAKAIARSVAADLRSVSSFLDREADDALIVDATSNGVVLKLGSTSNIEVRAITYPLQSGNRDLSKERGRAGVAVKINPGRVAEIVADHAVIRHELVHVLIPRRYDPLPLWISEGLAEYVGHLPRTVAGDRADNYAKDVDLSDRRRELVDSGNWGDDPEGDYLVARATVEYLVDSDGLERFYELMDDVIAAGEPDTEAAIDRALRRVYGLGSDAVARGSFANLG